MSDEIGEQGRRQIEVLRTLEEARDPVLTLDEVADRLETSIRDARLRLEDMEENGMVQRKQGVWWATPAPHLESEATAYLFPPDRDTPLSLDQIRDIVCEE